MTQRTLLTFQCTKLLLVSFGVLAFLTPAAAAALKKYHVRHRLQLNYSDTSPRVEFRSAVGPGVALIDDDGSGNPVLKKLLLIDGGNGRTVQVPCLGCKFWFKHTTREGPSPGQQGAGGIASTIDWGTLSDWTLTGGTYCRAVPTYLCGYASALNLGTVDSEVYSDEYDLGTWTFHGTGFTGNGYIYRTAVEGGLGNLLWFLRGAKVKDGTVPALPLLGVGAVAVGVFALGVVSIRRR